MKLFETITQTTKGKESTMIITVNYDPNEKCVDDIISFEVVTGKISTDITSIMLDTFDDQAQRMVDQIDWHLNYIAQIEQREDALETFDLADFANNMFKSMSRI